MMETAADRCAMLPDRAMVGAQCVPCIFTGQGSTDLDISSHDPTLIIAIESVAILPLGGTVDSIQTASGVSYGAHVVRVAQPQDDGGMVELQLEAAA